MDIVMVDYDCQMMFQDKARIRERLNLPKGTEIIFLKEAGGKGNTRKFSAADRCVFLTCFTGGIKKYHQDVFAGNPQILSWLIAVLDVEYENYKKQFLAQTDQAFYTSDAYYDVVFDCSDTLSETGKLCALPAKTQKRCLIVSGRQTLAEQVRSIMGNYLPSWETLSPEVRSAEDYRFADAVIVVGETAEDLAVPAPTVGLNRRYVWLDRRFLAAEEYEELTGTAGESMNECGWNIADYGKCLYTSDLGYEKLYQEILCGEIGYSALPEHEMFVMWDQYGLPEERKEYTQEHIDGFLKEHCCFENIARRIDNQHPREI